MSNAIFFTFKEKTHVITPWEPSYSGPVPCVGDYVNIITTDAQNNQRCGSFLVVKREIYFHSILITVE